MLELHGGSETIVISPELLASLIRSNISCHSGKIFTQELIDSMTVQIVESIVFYLDSKEV
jgi:hypothetical protein